MGKPKTKRALKDNEAKAVLRMLRGSGQKLNLVAAPKPLKKPPLPQQHNLQIQPRNETQLNSTNPAPIGFQFHPLSIQTIENDNSYKQFTQNPNLRTGLKEPASTPLKPSQKALSGYSVER